jgi:hypothetical protein
MEIFFPCSTYPQISFLQDEIGFVLSFFTLSETFSERVEIAFGILGRHPVFWPPR